MRPAILLLLFTCSLGLIMKINYCTIGKYSLKLGQMKNTFSKYYVSYITKVPVVTQFHHVFSINRSVRVRNSILRAEESLMLYWKMNKTDK